VALPTEGADARVLLLVSRGGTLRDHIFAVHAPKHLRRCAPARRPDTRAAHALREREARRTARLGPEEGSRIELGPARGPGDDRADAEQGHALLDSDLNGARQPTAIDRTPARDQYRSVGGCKPACLLRRTPGCPEGTKRDRGGRQRRRVGRGGSPKPTRQRKPGVGDANGHHQDQTHHSNQQQRRRPPLTSHRSTRIAARALISTDTPPNSGAATR
jgi:hypothetical protein